MNKITNVERKRFLELFYQGKPRKQIGAEVRRSPATVQRVIKEHEQKVKENGLIYELSEEGLTDALELARFYGELNAANVSVADCRDAIPIVQRCRSLEIEEETVNDLIDAAVRLGEPEFPRQQFAAALLRILKLEQATGQTVEQIESAHQQLSSEIQRLRSEETTLRTTISRLVPQQSQLEQDIQNGQRRLAALQGRLDRVPVTEAQLETYIADRTFLASNGFDMNDPARFRLIITQLRAMGFSPTVMINDLLRIGHLNVAIETLQKHVSDINASLVALTQQKNNLTKEIQELENKRDQIKVKVKEEEEDAHKRIMDSKARVINQLIEENVTMQQLADFVAAREALRKGGVQL